MSLISSSRLTDPFFRDPFSTFNYWNQMMDQLTNFGLGDMSFTFGPQLQVEDNANNVVIRLEVLGMNKEDISVLIYSN